MLTKRSIAPSLNTNHRVRLLPVKSTGAVLAGKENTFSCTWSPEMADEGGSHSPQRSTWRPSRQHSFQNQKWKASWPSWALSPNTATHTHRHKKKELREHSTGFKWHSQQAAAAPHLSQDAQADEDEFLFRDRQRVGKLIVLKQRGLALDPSASQSFSSPTPKACFERS